MVSGLTNEEVIASREKYGDNKLPERKLKTPFDFFKETFEDKMNRILVALMLFLLVPPFFGDGSFTEPIGIAIVLLVISIINICTGMRSQKSELDLKRRVSVRYCNVIRNGKVEHVNTEDLVVGDLVVVQNGEQVYADGYLVEGHLAVDNSVINGESEECKKTPIDGYIFDRNKEVTGEDYIDKNSLFSGTTIVEGEGKMIVTNVGINTVNGKTIISIGEIEQRKTSLQIQLDELADQISKFGYIGAIVIAIALIVSNILAMGGVDKLLSIGWLDAFSMALTIAITSITIVVAAVPEGLPLIISLITAQNANVMIKHNVLAKNTNKIPEAGNIQLLCTDKTGTLTGGKLIPVHVVNGAGEKLKWGDWDKPNSFIKNVVLNSSAMFDENGSIVGGNATERALLSMSMPDEFAEIANTHEIIDKKGFNSAYKYSAIRVKGKDNSVITYYKGAPEKLLAKAKKYETEQGVFDLDVHKMQDKVEDFANSAMRVIALGHSESEIGEQIPDDLVLTAIVAIRDDVRKEVPAAVEKMHKAGVQVMMVTGDTLSTAKAIARDSGIIKSPADIAMRADEFENLSDKSAKNLLPSIKVIARATPHTKLRIVRLAQELNLCVSMTGDGTNDAPALKAADVGFSMGSGTDVCKEAGDIIITDDNFVSITDAVLLGRTFMHNVMKFLKFQLPINFSLVILSVLYPLILGVQAISAVQILIINIVMDSLNSLSFGGEPAKEEYMFEKPIEKGSKLLSRETMSQIAVSTISFIALFGITMTPAVRNAFVNEEIYSTMRFALLVIMATINGFNIRTDKMNLLDGISKNKLFVIIACSIFTGTFLISQFGGAVVNCYGMNADQWLFTVILAAMVVPIDWIRKIIIGRNEDKDYPMNYKEKVA